MNYLDYVSKQPQKARRQLDELNTKSLCGKVLTFVDQRFPAVITKCFELQKDDQNTLKAGELQKQAVTDLFGFIMDQIDYPEALNMMQTAFDGVYSKHTSNEKLDSFDFVSLSNQLREMQACWLNARLQLSKRIELAKSDSTQKEAQLTKKSLFKSTEEFCYKMTKALTIKNEQILFNSNRHLRLDVDRIRVNANFDKHTDFQTSQKVKDFVPTFVKYIGKNLLFVWGKSDSNEESHRVYFFSSLDLSLKASSSSNDNKPIHIYDVCHSEKVFIAAASKNTLLVWSHKDLNLKKQVFLDAQPIKLVLQKKTVGVLLQSGHITELDLKTLEVLKINSFGGQSDQLIPSIDNTSFLHSSINQNGIFVLQSYEKSKWLSYNVYESKFFIQNEKGTTQTVQIDGLQDFKGKTLVEINTSSQFWVVRDQANSYFLIQNQILPQEGAKVDFQPQKGKQIEVIDSNETLAIIGIHTNGFLWRREIHKTFF